MSSHSFWSSLFTKFSRRKVCNEKSQLDGLKKALSTFDLTLLGIGSCIGIGIYVLAGVVAKTSAGPAVVVSFFIAAFASILAGLCYAEFGARVPKAGSAYSYSYTAVGELIAFIVGWNLLLEYAIGVASVAKAYSIVIDTLTNHAMVDAFKSCCSINVSFLSSYFDWFGFFISEVVAVILAMGVKESAMFNNIFTALNVAVVLFVLIVGSALSNTANWRLRKEDILASNPQIKADMVGDGGFAPFGFQGIIKGAATCFYGLVGFDTIAASAEEAKYPQKSIPLAIIFSQLIVFLAYFGTATVVTMMVPYYLQDSEAPLAEAFAQANFIPGKWIVTIGALCGHAASLLTAMFPMPRVIYAMSHDGVIFKFLSKIHPRFRTPALATMISGTIGGIMAAFFDLGILIDMMSIGTLSAYTLVAVCILCLRYRKDDTSSIDKDLNDEVVKSETSLRNSSLMSKCWNLISQMFNLKNYSEPTHFSSRYSDIIVSLYSLVTIIFSGTATYGYDGLTENNMPIIISLAMMGIIMLFFLVSLSRQPTSTVELSFKVPLVPWLPGLSILINIFFMLKMSWSTWTRFAVWMAIGFVIYGICLCNGTTDAAYQEYLVNNNIECKLFEDIFIKNESIENIETDAPTVNSVSSDTIQSQIQPSVSSS